MAPLLRNSDDDSCSKSLPLPDLLIVENRQEGKGVKKKKSQIRNSTSQGLKQYRFQVFKVTRLLNDCGRFSVGRMDALLGVTDRDGTVSVTAETWASSHRRAECHHPCCHSQPSLAGASIPFHARCACHGVFTFGDS